MNIEFYTVSENDTDITIMLNEPKLSYENCAKLDFKPENYRSKNLILDVKNLKQLDASGIGEILQCYRMSRINNISFSIINANSKIKDTLYRYRLHKFMDID